MTLMRTDRLEEAYGYIQRAYEKKPDDPAVLDSLGWVLYRLGRHDEALGYLRRAAGKLEDGEIAAHLGEVLWESGRHDEANKVWDEALKFDPEHPVLKHTLERYRP